MKNEYYVTESDRESCLFSWDQQRGQFGLGKPVNFEAIAPIKIRLGSPIPESPRFVDFHEMPAPVVSTSIYDVLAPMNIYGIQWVPAKVRNPQDPNDEPRDYWFMHVWNQIQCLDTDNSELEYSRSGNTIFGIEKLVLDEKSLGLFDLQKRLIFELTEDTSVLLVHQSIKDAILSVNPTGIRFFPASEWNSDSSFE